MNLLELKSNNQNKLYNFEKFFLKIANFYTNAIITGFKNMFYKIFI